MSTSFAVGDFIIISTLGSRFDPPEHRLMRVFGVRRDGSLDRVGSPRLEPEAGRGVPFAKIAAYDVRTVDVRRPIPEEASWPTLDAALAALT